MATDAPEEFEPEETYIIPNPVLQDGEREEPGEAEHNPSPGETNLSSRGLAAKWKAGDLRMHITYHLGPHRRVPPTPPVSPGAWTGE